MIYSTCTFNTLENEENLRWLCSEFGAESLPLSVDPSWGIVTTEEKNISGYRFYPHQVKGEGFFLSVIRKTASSGHAKSQRVRSSLVRPSGENLRKLMPWINEPEGKHFFVHRDQLRFIVSPRLDETERIIQGLRTVCVGTAAATIKQGKLVPEHSLALSLSLNRDDVNEIEVDEVTALRLLRKESIDLAGAGRGFAAVTFRGLVLAWVNVLPGRVNNLLPSHRRIRMSLSNGGL